jgi:hypothetical protein
MTRPFNLHDLDPHDVLVLRDLVRFGVLADDQIGRRYGDSSHATTRLQELVEAGLVEPWPRLIEDTSMYSASRAGARVAGCGLSTARPKHDHLRHDVAVVDLADYILEHEPGADFRSEREVARVLRAGLPSTRGWGLTARGHMPDGLVLADGKRLAIELEHTSKSIMRYAEICRWFALNVRVDGIRWYVDDPKTMQRIRRVNEQHGFAQDVDVTYAPFPPGVVVRPWHRPNGRVS